MSILLSATVPVLTWLRRKIWKKNLKITAQGDVIFSLKYLRQLPVLWSGQIINISRARGRRTFPFPVFLNGLSHSGLFQTRLLFPAIISERSPLLKRLMSGLAQTCPSQTMIYIPVPETFLARKLCFPSPASRMAQRSNQVCAALSNPQGSSPIGGDQRACLPKTVSGKRSQSNYYQDKPLGFHNWLFDLWKVSRSTSTRPKNVFYWTSGTLTRWFQVFSSRL